MAREVFITTHDNPYNYFTQFDQWLDYDRQMGYYTLEYLARIAMTSDNLGEEAYQQELELAIDSIIEWNGSFYKKIYSNDDLSS